MIVTINMLYTVVTVITPNFKVLYFLTIIGYNLNLQGFKYGKSVDSTCVYYMYLI